MTSDQISQRIACLRAEISKLEIDLIKRLDLESTLAKQTEHESIRTLSTRDSFVSDPDSEFQVCATWPRPTAACSAWEIGVGRNGRLLAVYSVTTYRGNYGFVKYGSVPDAVDSAIRRAFDMKRPGH